MQARTPAPFVVGASRSGTTLLRLMLDAHPLLAIPAETHFVPALVRAWESAADRVGALVRVLVGHERFVDLGLAEELVAAAIAARAPETPGDALRVVYRLYADRRGKPRWGDKTPGYVLHLPLLHRVLPEARFVHVLRDGRDIALSLRGLPFGPRTVEEAAAWWADRVATGRAAAPELPVGAYLEVRYEDLVTRPHAVLREVCRHLELPFDERMLAYHVQAGERLAETDAGSGAAILATAAGRASRARLQTPPDERRVGRWRELMTRDEQRRFAAIAGPVLEELGYPC